jgi:hypothetical protein
MAGPEYHLHMIRQNRFGLRALNRAPGAIFAAGLVAVALSIAPAQAQDSKSKTQAQAKPAAGKPQAGSAAKVDPKKPAAAAAAAAAPAAAAAAGGANKPNLVAQFGTWTVYSAASGRAKTCYALGQPSERKPELKRDPAYLFVSTRPAESVRNEVSIVMGFDVKPDSTPTAQIGTASFDMVAKGSNLWVKNAAAEGQFVDGLRKGGRLVVKAPSKRGNLTTDTYPLTGLAQALDRVHKDCP